MNKETICGANIEEGKEQKDFSKDKFRIQCRNLFITFKNEAGMSHTNFIEKYTKQFNTKIRGMIVAYEQSDSDYKYEHWHILITFKDKINIKGSKTLDFHNIHGNYEKVRSLNKTVRYVTKGSSYEIYGIDPHQDAIQKNKKPFNKFIGMCIFNVINKEQAYSIKRRESFIKDIDIIADYYTSPAKYQRFLNEFYRENDNDECVVFIKTEVLAKITNAISSRKQSVFIYGATGTGKTSCLTRLLGNSGLLVRHTDRLKVLDPNIHKYVLFDDMMFNHVGYSYLINIVDATHESHFNVKGSMIPLPSSIRKIFTHNLPAEKWCSIKENKRKKEKIITKNLSGEYYENIEEKEVERIDISEDDDEQLKAVLRRLNVIKIEHQDILFFKTMPDLINNGYVIANEETFIKFFENLKKPNKT